jgi:hypothetical protein
VPNESQFLRLHTSKYANLGCYSSKRAESFHPVLKALLNQQLSLEEATRRLGSTIVSIIKKRATAESQEGKNLPRTLDFKAFTYLVDHITIFAISKISAEWEATKVAIINNSLLPIFITCTECELMLRYSLPCRHHLAQACLTGQPIPKSLVHPRWWIHGPKITQSNWTPSYHTAELQGLACRSWTLQSNYRVTTAFDTKLKFSTPNRVSYSLRRAFNKLQRYLLGCLTR